MKDSIEHINQEYCLRDFISDEQFKLLTNDSRIARDNKRDTVDEY